MSKTEEIALALLEVETSAANLERIAKSQDWEFSCLLCDLARNLRLLARFFQAVSETEVVAGLHLPSAAVILEVPARNTAPRAML